MVKAVIFDCFGVLTTEAWLPFKTEHFGHNAAMFEQASSIAQAADSGKIDYEDFMVAVAKLADITPDEARSAIARNVPNEPLFDYLRELKPNYKLGFLSNIAGNYLHQIFKPEQIQLFDSVVLSYESGYIKPQVQAFEAAAGKLAVEASECVVIDDQERNVNGARQAGMHGILYESVEQLRSELEPLLKA